jgi:hypothetical protein
VPSNGFGIQSGRGYFVTAFVVLVVVFLRPAMYVGKYMLVPSLNTTVSFVSTYPVMFCLGAACAGAAKRSPAKRRNATYAYFIVSASVIAF